MNETAFQPIEMGEVKMNILENVVLISMIDNDDTVGVTSCRTIIRFCSITVRSISPEQKYRSVIITIAANIL